jgi:hypothetical protein
MKPCSRKNKVWITILFEANKKQLFSNVFLEQGRAQKYHSEKGFRWCMQKNDVKGCRQTETNKKKKEKRQTPLA